MAKPLADRRKLRVDVRVAASQERVDVLLSFGDMQGDVNAGALGALCHADGIVALLTFGGVKSGV